MSESSLKTILTYRYVGKHQFCFSGRAAISYSLILYLPKVKELTSCCLVDIVVEAISVEEILKKLLDHAKLLEGGKKPKLDLDPHDKHTFKIPCTGVRKAYFCGLISL